MAIYEVKLIKKRRSLKLMSLLGSKFNLDRLTKASGVRWYGHALKRDNHDGFGRALDFEVEGRRGREQPNMSWKSILIILG